MYFPKSQITPNLYTNGEELIYLSTKQNYIGYYWKTQSGKYYTGKTPQDTPTQELVVASKVNGGNPQAADNNPAFNSAFDINVSSPNLTVSYGPLGYPNSNYRPLLMPTYSPSIPTENDYKLGEYRRYFCKKANEIIYLEIDKNTFEKLIKQDLNYYWQLYVPFNIPWKLVGEKEEVYKVNKNIVEFVTVKKRAYKFDIYLQKDYTKYYKKM